MLVLPNYSWFVWIITIIIFGVYFNPWTKQIRHPRNSLLLIIIATSVAIPIQAYFLYDMTAYDSGSTNLQNISANTMLSPGETYTIPSASNWYTVAAVFLYVSNESQEIVFYMVDENIPDQRFDETILNETYFAFTLPYMYTGPLLIANWSICFANPSENETLHLQYQSIWMEDNMLLAQWRVYHPYTAPYVALLCLWLYVPLALTVLGEISFKKPERNRSLLFMAISLAIVSTGLALPYMGNILFFGLPLTLMVVIPVTWCYYIKRKGTITESKKSVDKPA